MDVIWLFESNRTLRLWRCRGQSAFVCGFGLEMENWL
jgi:hypothetical protein